MDITIRRVGNSLGVIIPKHVLESWGVGEGDHLVLTDNEIRPPRVQPSARARSEEYKRQLAAAVVSHFSAREIRARILANLDRYEQQNNWISTYDEWLEIAEGDDDWALFAVMLGRDERSARLRDEAPYVGMLPKDEVKKIKESFKSRPA